MCNFILCKRASKDLCTHVHVVACVTRIRTYRADDGISKIEAVVKIPIKAIRLSFGVIINRFLAVLRQLFENFVVIVFKVGHVMCVKQS